MYGGSFLEDDVEEMEFEPDADADALDDEVGPTARVLRGDHREEDAMDESPDDAQPPWLDTMPPPDVRFLAVVNHQVRYNWSAVPAAVPGFPPNVMRAVAKDETLAREHQDRVARHMCMPLLVHTSPLVLLFAGHYQAPAGHQGSMADMERAWWPQCMPLPRSLVHLYQLRDAALKGRAIKLAAVNLKAIEEAYREAITTLANNHDGQLDAMYDAFNHEPTPEALQHFWALCARYSLAVVHLEERLVYEALLAPYDGVPPLACVLTPSELPPPPEVGSAAYTELRQHARLVFALKAERAPEKKLRAELLNDAPRSDDVCGWCPLQLLVDYYRFADE